MSNVSADIRELAEPATREETVKQLIERAARRAGFAYWRAFDIWYGKARRVTDEEHECIATALEKKRREATRNDLHELKIRLARLESRLVQTDAEFHRETIHQIGNAVRGRG